jgi:hypothetical protein
LSVAALATQREGIGGTGHIVLCLSGEECWYESSANGCAKVNKNLDYLFIYAAYQKRTATPWRVAASDAVSAV